MKCPQCSRSQPRKDGTTCLQCRYSFVFSGYDGMTDGRWLAIVRKASADGTYFFTEDQLFACYAHRLGIRVGSVGAGLLLLAAFPVIFLSALLAELTSLGMPGLLLRFSALAVIAWLALRTLDQGKGSVEAGYGNRDVLREKFAVQLASWQAKYPLEKLLEGRKLEAPPPDWKEEDVYDYGAERVLVVDDDALVDFFVLNDFHAQQRCAVVSRSGYPSYVVPRVRAMLERRADLPVFVLHDSSDAGQVLVYELKKLGLGVQDHPVTDLGWSPRDVHAIRGLGFLDAESRAGDIAVDLIPPRRLLRCLAASLERGVPLAAFLGASAVSSAWDDHGDRHWLLTDTEDFG